MGKFFWILGGTALAIGIYAVMQQQNEELASANGAKGIDDWGTKQRVAGTGGQLKGKVEGGAGDLLGSEKLANQGAFDQAAGAVQDAAGKAAGAVADAVRGLNK